jgi:hypothetical protein
MAEELTTGKTPILISVKSRRMNTKIVRGIAVTSSAFSKFPSLQLLAHKQTIWNASSAGASYVQRSSLPRPPQPMRASLTKRPLLVIDHSEDVEALVDVDEDEVEERDTSLPEVFSEQTPPSEQHHISQQTSPLQPKISQHVRPRLWKAS